MLSSLIRTLLIFISGIFILLSQIEDVMRYMSYVSPLTYLADLFHSCIGGNNVLLSGDGLVAFIIFSAIFFLLSLQIHKRNMVKGSEFK